MRTRYSRRQDGRNVLALMILLLLLLGLYFTLRANETGKTLEWRRIFSFMAKSPSPKYPVGQQVIQLDDNRVGQILESSVEFNQNQKEIRYTIDYGGQDKREVFETQLTPIKAPFEIGQTVTLAPDLYGNEIEGVIEEILKEENDFSYVGSFTSLGRLEGITNDDLSHDLKLTLFEENDGLANLELIKEALHQTTEFGYTRILFPKGRYLIGSSTPEKDYILLPSNVELLGDDTTLIIDQASYWLGLANGVAATDGLSNFVMDGLNFEAKDLQNGAEFKLMANHGYNWQIRNNRFTMVHKMSSHVFDLGGVQYALFENNIFEGYAPELTTVTSIGDRHIHNFYSEAIQLDASSNNGVWDGGLLQEIDPNYAIYNEAQYLSSYITIVNNQFLPYYDEQDNLVAYGASLGQHSSEVGVVSIYGNYFLSTLSARFLDKATQDSRWAFEPIHFLSWIGDFSVSNVIE